MTNQGLTFLLRGRCQRCGRFIDIELKITFQDRPEYGKTISYIPQEIPLYLKNQLRNAQDFFDGFNTTWKFQKPSSTGSLPAYNPGAPICKNCSLVEKLRQ